MPISLQESALGILATWETPQESCKAAEVAKQKGWQFLQDPKGDQLHAHLIKPGTAVRNTLTLVEATRALRKANLEVI